MIGLKKISPHETVEIDVKNLRDEQTPDERGNTIPINVNSGQVKWTIRSEKYDNDYDVRKADLIGRSEQIDTINGISSSYACVKCCQKYADGYIFPYSSVADVEVGDQIQFGAREDGYDCYGNYYFCYLDNDDVDWSSSNHNVATISNLGLVTIVGVGDVEIDGDWWVTRTTNYGGYCPDPPLSPEEEKGKSNRTKKKDAEQILAPDCSVCHTAPFQIDSHVNISAKPKVIINVPSNALDGATVSFSAATEDGSPATYQWSFEPTSGGNNPQVNFTAPTGATTMAKPIGLQSPIFHVQVLTADIPSK